MHKQIEFIPVFKINDSGFRETQFGSNMVQQGGLAALPGPYNGYDFR
jgi:hypothetical protein